MLPPSKHLSFMIDVTLCYLMLPFTRCNIRNIRERRSQYNVDLIVQLTFSVSSSHQLKIWSISAKSINTIYMMGCIIHHCMCEYTATHSLVIGNSLTCKFKGLSPIPINSNSLFEHVKFICQCPRLCPATPKRLD